MVYLDHAATTHMWPEAVARLTELSGPASNPASIHTAGRAAKRIVEDSRELIADYVGARPTDVVFTSGGTEADNLALQGLFLTGREQGKTHIVISDFEHHAILDTALWLEKTWGATVHRIGVDDRGVINLDQLRAVLAEYHGQIAVVSIMWVNNEVGTVQPMETIGEIVKTYDLPWHTDAVQALGWVPHDFSARGLDAMTVSGHKVGGPVGVGGLVLRREQQITPVLHGGGQERRIRSGTVATAQIGAFAAAVERLRDTEAERTAQLDLVAQHLVDGVHKLVPDAIFRGMPLGPQRASHIVHFTFPGCHGDSLLYLLDSHGIYTSTGSACTAGVLQPSHVLMAMGLSAEESLGALRFSLSHTTTIGEIDTLLGVLPEVVARAKAAGLT